MLLERVHQVDPCLFIYTSREGLAPTRRELTDAPPFHFRRPCQPKTKPKKTCSLHEKVVPTIPEPGIAGSFVRTQKWYSSRHLIRNDASVKIPWDPQADPSDTVGMQCGLDPDRKCAYPGGADRVLSHVSPVYQNMGVRTPEQPNSHVVATQFTPPCPFDIRRYEVLAKSRLDTTTVQTADKSDLHACMEQCYRWSGSPAGVKMTGPTPAYPPTATSCRGVIHSAKQGTCRLLFTAHNHLPQSHRQSVVDVSARVQVAGSSGASLALHGNGPFKPSSFTPASVVAKETNASSVEDSATSIIDPDILQLLSHDNDDDDARLSNFPATDEVFSERVYPTLGAVVRSRGTHSVASYQDCVAYAAARGEKVWLLTALDFMHNHTHKDATLNFASTFLRNAESAYQHALWGDWASGSLAQNLWGSMGTGAPAGCLRLAGWRRALGDGSKAALDRGLNSLPAYAIRGR